MQLRLLPKTGEKSNQTDLFWQAQRADLLGQSDVALKNYNRLLKKLPESAVAVDRLYNVAIAQGDFPSALKAARAQQLANSGDAAVPLIFFVDAWQRKDWKGAAQATEWLKERNLFAFITPILDAWIDVAEGKQGLISNTALRDSGLLYYYTYDQLIFLDLANNNAESAKRRLSGFPSFGDDYARHMAMTSAEHLGRKGEADYANSLLEHLAVEPVVFTGKNSDLIAGQGLAAARGDSHQGIESARNRHVLRLFVQHHFRFLGFFPCLIVQGCLKPLGIELVGPLGHNQRCHAVTDKVGQCPRFRHEAVDTENQGQTSNRYRTHRRQGRR